MSAATVEGDLAAALARITSLESMVGLLAQRPAGGDVLSLASQFQLPASVVSSSTQTEIPEVEGALKPAMPAGIRLAAFSYTIKGNATVEPPTGATTGFSEALIEVVQNAAGGHKISTAGITWVGGEPAWNEAANAVNLISIFTTNGGATWRGAGPLTGATGAAGPTGPEAVGTRRLFRPSAVNMVVKPSGTEEARPVLAETLSRAAITQSLQLVSGTPVIGAVEVPAKTKYKGVGFYVWKLEGTPANRAHLWVAVLNSAREKLHFSEDFTESAHTGFAENGIKALNLGGVFESGPEPELLYLVLCEVMSSTEPIQIAAAANTGRGAVLGQAEPWLAFLGPVGQTTGAALEATVSKSATTEKAPYLVLV